MKGFVYSVSIIRYIEYMEAFESKSVNPVLDIIFYGKEAFSTGHLGLTSMLSQSPLLQGYPGTQTTQ